VKPLVSFVMMAFNHEAVIAEAVTAALAQDYSPLEIIISDDGSNDATFEVLNHIVAAYRGPHAVRTRRAAKNAGIASNFNYLIGESRGQFIVYADGDDISLPQRTSVLVQRWEAGGEGDALIFSDVEAIDREGRPVSGFPNLAAVGETSIGRMAQGRVSILCAASAMSRSLADGFDAMLPSLTHVDRVLAFRALLMGGRVEAVNEKLVRYRTAGGISRSRPLTGRGYLFGAGRASHARMLEDARQRLRDARNAAPGDTALHRACTATVADHEAFLDFADAPRWSLEARLATWLGRGARPGPLLRLYLKHRLAFFFDLYYRRVRASPA
jgi:glycosyltransferase involved in cell wall biosynthesis